MAEQRKILDHLLRDYDQPVRDPVWQHIPLSSPLMRVMEMRSFQKLSGIKQLGPAYLVYPGATHTRLNHSLGVFHVARRMILQLLSRGDSPGFSLPGVKAFLCAALLHDLGHYPFAHSLKDLEILSHEELTASLILSRPAGREEAAAGAAGSAGGSDDYPRVIGEEVGADPQLVAAIIDRRLPYSGPEDAELFRNLLSGVLDPDKLDYFNRDAYFCGIPYGIQDVDFVLEEVVPHPRSGLAVSRKGLTAVESILFSKYLMYRAVYWHKTVRIATSMIKKALLMGLSAGVIRPQDLYWIGDAEFFALAASIDYPPFRLVGEVAQRRLHKLVLRVPFQAGRPAHARLMSLGERMAVEEELAREAGRKLGRRVEPQEVVIDLPEPISFEIDVPVLDQGTGTLVPFRQSESVFSEQVIEGFRRSLRTVSLCCSRDEALIDALRAIGEERLGPAER